MCIRSECFDLSTIARTSGFTTQPALIIMAKFRVTYFAGIVGLFLTFATTVLVFFLAITFTLAHSPTHILAIVAAVLQVLSLPSLAYILLRQRNQLQESMKDGRHGSQRESTHVVFIASLFWLVVGAVTIATLGWMEAVRTRLAPHVAGVESSTFLHATVAVWALSVLAQIAFIVSTALFHNQSREEIFLSVEYSPEPTAEMTETSPTNTFDPAQASLRLDSSRPNTSDSTRSNPFRGGRVSIDASSAVVSDPLSSLRSSISDAVRPGSSSRPGSSRRLLGRQHSYTRESRACSLESANRHRISQDESFDSWDTSGVNQQIRETVLQSSPLVKGTALEPIPGSRSPSPAKALEGPFFELQLPPSPTTASPPQSPLMERPQSPPPTFPRPNMLQRSASSASEDHIHPLFRSSSPLPPPSSTPGTNVTAAPFAGQLINERILSRMRSGSAPSSPSPLVQTNGFDFSSPPMSPSTLVHADGFDTAPQSPQFRSHSFDQDVLCES